MKERINSSSAYRRAVMLQKRKKKDQRGEKKHQDK